VRKQTCVRQHWDKQEKINQKKPRRKADLTILSRPRTQESVLPDFQKGWRSNSKQAGEFDYLREKLISHQTKEGKGESIEETQRPFWDGE